MKPYDQRKQAAPVLGRQPDIRRSKEGERRTFDRLAEIGSDGVQQEPWRIEIREPL